MREVRHGGSWSTGTLRRLTGPWPDLRRALLPGADGTPGPADSLRVHAERKVRQFLRLAWEAGPGSDRIVPVATLVKALLLSGLPMSGDHGPMVYHDDEMFLRHRAVFNGDDDVLKAMEVSGVRDHVREYLEGALTAEEVFDALVAAAVRLTAPETPTTSTVQKLFGEVLQFLQAEESAPYLAGEGPTGAMHPQGPLFAYRISANAGHRSLARTGGTPSLFRYEGAYHDRFTHLAELFATPERVREEYARTLTREGLAVTDWRNGWLLADDPLHRISRTDPHLTELDHGYFDMLRAQHRATTQETRGLWDFLHRVAGDQPPVPVEGEHPPVQQVTDAARELFAVYALAAGKALPDFRQGLADRTLPAVVTAAVTAAGLRRLDEYTGVARHRTTSTGLPYTVGHEFGLGLAVGTVGDAPSGTGNVEIVYEAFPSVTTGRLFPGNPAAPVIFRPGARGVVTAVEFAPELSTPGAYGYRVRVVPMGEQIGPPIEVHPPTGKFKHWIGWLGPVPFQRFQVRRYELGDGTVLARLVTSIHLRPHDGVTPEKTAAIKELAAKVVRVHHNVGHRFPNGDLVEFAVEFTDDADRCHHVVDLLPGAGRASNATWYVTTLTLVLLHEASHLFGGEDWYQEHRPRPLDEDGSVMSAQHTDKRGEIRLNADLPVARGSEVRNQRWLPHDLSMLWSSIERAQLAAGDVPGEGAPRRAGRTP